MSLVRKSDHRPVQLVGSDALTIEVPGEPATTVATGTEADGYAYSATVPALSGGAAVKASLKIGARHIETTVTAPQAFSVELMHAQPGELRVRVPDWLLVQSPPNRSLCGEVTSYVVTSAAGQAVEGGATSSVRQPATRHGTTRRSSRRTFKNCTSSSMFGLAR
jgi:hypothetical protein